MSVPSVQLSRLVSRVLRHEPRRYDVEVDEQGWASVERLLEGIRRRGGGWADIDRADLREMIDRCAKRRFEMDSGRIRARYGHSLPGRISQVEAAPPTLLFHGTSPRGWAAIRRTGLRPMGRQYVHLSIDVDTARQVGRRKSTTPVILVVRTTAARAAGTRFWLGNDQVWLADHVPTECIDEAADRTSTALDQRAN